MMSTVTSSPDSDLGERPQHRCRFCQATLEVSVLDLGSSPLANSYLEPRDLDEPESFYPLCVYLCENCWLAQLPAVTTAEAIFSDYAYFSSFSDSWLAHAKQFVERVTRRLNLGTDSLVVEVASNDGYLLQYAQELGLRVLGIEPAQNVAVAAREKGIETIARFFGAELGEELAEQGIQADLMVSNNVLAHVPDLNDFVAGFTHLLAPDGVWTIEVPHLLRLLDETQFDTIYHEHFSYFSLHSASTVLDAHGLAVFDVEELPTHGGSLRLWVKHASNRDRPVESAVERLLEEEAAAGLLGLDAYASFESRVQAIKCDLLRFLIDAQERNEQVVAYGAPAKGNTLLNYCGIGPDLVTYTVDRSPHKQGRYLPGTRIPIHAPDKIRQTRPAWVLILPWNLEAEIRQQMADIEDWGGRFVVPVPIVRVLD